MENSDIEPRPREILGLLYDAADVGMCVTDAQRRFVTVNRAYEHLYGYTEEELRGREFTMLVDPAERETVASLHDRFLAGETDETAGEWEFIRRDGERRVVLVTAGRLQTSDGKRYKVTTVYDITERNLKKRNLETDLKRRELLVREMHHRVKNHLASLESMLRLQLQTRRDDTVLLEALTDSINRIKTMSRLYDRLNSAQNLDMVELDSYLDSLVTDLLATAADTSAVQAETHVDSAECDVDTAIALGLIANELVTNSLKHAVGSGAGTTRIRVRLRAENETFSLEVEDTGGGLPEDFLETRRTTLGLQLVTAVVEQHRGSIELVEPQAARLRVRIPRPGNTTSAPPS
jgi:PAS domain S-box-containing protein